MKCNAPSPDRNGNPFCVVFFNDTKRLERIAGFRFKKKKLKTSLLYLKSRTII
jgi:hypothetical protein